MSCHLTLQMLAVAVLFEKDTVGMLNFRPLQLTKFNVVPTSHSTRVILDKTYATYLPQLFWLPLL